ncbi:MAG: DNA repair protein RecN [Oscillospiraceae bacterium]|nr:DNA repair protein RecN [Oscillospiraceae bacterium]
MLKSLQIENIATIEKLSVDFSDGLNVLTGETGAGKSVLVDSINAVTGEKTSRDLIRTGEASACVTALFADVSDAVILRLSDSGISVEDDKTLLIQRRLYRDGKNACRINGMTVTVGMLRSVASLLINIHGQRDSQQLLDEAYHLKFVDGYAEDGKLLEEYRSEYRLLCGIKARLRDLQTDETEKARMADLLSYQINELENADIRPGEKKELVRKKSFLENSQKIKNALGAALNALIGDGEEAGASGALSAAAGYVGSVTGAARGLEPVYSQLAAVADSVSDIASVIDDVIGQLDTIDGDIDSVEERLDVLYRLSRKYGDTEEQMLAFLEDAKTRLDGIVHSDEERERLTEEYGNTLARAEKKAVLLSDARRKAGEALCAAIESELKFLDMPNVRFVTEIKPVPLCENGADEVRFLISANPGEEPKPLGKTASGGELSRVMLAIKNVLTDSDGVGTLIFDEIDTGVSGSAAGKIAVKLASVSLCTQVFCITHLSRIAAFADEHIFLSKVVQNGKTYTRAEILSPEKRAAELARITFGSEFTDVQLSSGEQMIEEAMRQKQKIKKP